MDCHDYQSWLQTRFDGVAPATSEGLHEHLLDCSACRSWDAAARRLEDGLRLLTRPAVPEGLTQRVVSGVLQQRRRVRFRQRLLVGTALAASLALVLLGGYAAWLSSSGDSAGTRAEGPGLAALAAAAPPDRPKTAPLPLYLFQGNPARQLVGKAFQGLDSLVSLTAGAGDGASATVGGPWLREGVVEMGTAVASWTRRTADQTVEQSSPLLRDVARLSLPNLDLEPALEPPARSLLEASQGVPMGLQPVTDSARRAVDLFLREVPPLTPDDK